MVTKKTIREKKKITRRKAGKKAAKRKIPGWIILLGGMLIGLSIALFGYINGWVPKPDNPNEKPIAQQQETKNTAQVEDNSNELSIEPNIKQKDNFDFYETLQEMEVVIDTDELTQTNNREPSTYFIQLGAFKNPVDAESLKAQIAFSGKTAIIETVVVNQITWHRVRLGPYNSSRKADVDKRNLEKNSFNPIIIKQK